MREENRGFRHESEVLIRHLDGHLASLRCSGGTDLHLAEEVAGVLRVLVTDTTFACAADRARVRAAVHYFLLRRGGRGHRRLVRAVSEDVRVVNEIAHALRRDDLYIRQGELVPA
jgi:hypothetical protein